MSTTNLKIISRVNTGSYAEYHTPTKILDSVYEMFGVVELDPASNAGIPHVRAERHFTVANNGLALPWIARTLWLNPPYGKEIGKWTHTLAREYESGNVDEALLLVPGKVETVWFQELQYPRCEIKGRLHFLTPY